MEFLQHVVVDDGVADKTNTRCQLLHQLAHRFVLATRCSTRNAQTPQDRGVDAVAVALDDLHTHTLVQHPAFYLQWLPRFVPNVMYQLNFVPAFFFFRHAKNPRFWIEISGFWRFGTKINEYSRESGARVSNSRDKCSPTEVILSSSITLCCC